MIRGKNVRLRPIERKDLESLRRWLDDSEVMRFWAAPQPLVSEQSFEGDLNGRFAQFDSAGYFIIEDPAGSAIGRIDFERLSIHERSAEVMILIGEKDARGKGYGTDAMTALLGYLFHQRDLHRVWLTVLVDNTAALKSYERAGFVNEGTLREDLYFDGKTHDQFIMSILRHEFDQMWSTAQSSGN
jgi:RimJ/RimL family protein N-acetyltransferase